VLLELPLGLLLLLLLPGGCVPCGEEVGCRPAAPPRWLDPKLQLQGLQLHCWCYAIRNDSFQGVAFGILGRAQRGIPRLQHNN